MSIVLNVNDALLYYPITKCANSSIRSALLTATGVEHNEVSVYKKSDLMFAVNEMDNCLTVNNGFQVLVVVRDPLSRLWSAYNNKVVEERCSFYSMELFGYKPTMTFEDFLNHSMDIGARCGKDNMEIHSKPMVEFLDFDVASAMRDSRYHFCFTRDTAAIEGVLSQAIGKPVTLPHTNESKKKVMPNLHSALFEDVKKFWADDFNFAIEISLSRNLIG